MISRFSYMAVHTPSMPGKLLNWLKLVGNQVFFYKILLVGEAKAELLFLDLFIRDTQNSYAFGRKKVLFMDGICYIFHYTQIVFNKIGTLIRCRLIKSVFT